MTNCFAFRTGTQWIQVPSQETTYNKRCKMSTMAAHNKTHSAPRRICIYIRGTYYMPRILNTQYAVHNVCRVYAHTDTRYTMHTAYTAHSIRGAQCVPRIHTDRYAAHNAHHVLSVRYTRCALCTAYINTPIRCSRIRQHNIRD